MQKPIGQQLSAARRRKKLTLADASEELYIREEILQLMEEDRFEEFPSIAQARGFLRLYADFLSLDRESLLNQLVPADPEVYEETITEPEPKHEVLEDTDTSKTVRHKRFPFLHKKESVNEVDPQQNTVNKKSKASEPPGEQTNESIIDAQQVYEQIGSEIRQNREALGLTLSDLQRATSIKSKHLEWIEAGMLENFSSPIQARGLLSNYVQYMSMDVDAILLRYANAVQSHRQENPAISKNERIKKVPSKLLTVLQYISPNLLLALFLLISMVCLLVWGIDRVSRNSTAAATFSAPPISEVLLSTQESTQMVISIGEATSLALTEENLFITPDTLTTLDLIIASETSTPAGSLQMNISVNQRTYLLIIADGIEKVNGRVKAGDTFQVSANQTIELATGNAAAISVVYGQNDLGIMGNPGEAFHLVFSVNGAFTPTPKASPTPTPTTAATKTPTPTITSPAPTVTPLIP